MKNMTRYAYNKLRRRCPLLPVFLAQYETLCRSHEETRRLWEKVYFEGLKPLGDKLYDIEEAQKALDSEFKEDFGITLAEVKAFLDSN